MTKESIIMDHSVLVIVCFLLSMSACLVIKRRRDAEAAAKDAENKIEEVKTEEE